MRAIVFSLTLLLGAAASAGERDVPPSAYFALDGLEANVGNLQRVIGRGCDAPEINSLDRSTEGYLYRAIYVATRQLVHSDSAVGERAYTTAEQHIRDSREIADRALDAAFRFADISRQNGCLDLAEKYYRRIVTTFIGNSYTEARERAQGVIDGMTTKR
jgi:hypothetical protein